MPRRDDIKKVLIIGSGPIVIGQACEFDYSGTQACKALRSLGYQIVLVNSNPATIMTDPGMADVTYIEPLTVPALTEIIEKERPDALLPNLGGQTGLNLSSQLAKAGVLAKYGVRIIGVEADAIEKGEDRIVFKETMKRLGIDMPQERAGVQRRGSGEGRRGARLSGRHPPGLHAGRHRRRPRLQRRGTARRRQPRPRRQHGGPDPRRGIRARLGGTGTRSRPRRQEPDDHRLLHRERGRDGRAHRRLLLRRADADD